MATRPDPDQFEDLYRSHRGSVYRFLLRSLSNKEDAEDATQTAFLQAYTAYERGTKPERPQAWLITIADNLRRRRFRARERRGVDELPLHEELVEAHAVDPRVADLHEALETLPFNQRAAIVLREVAGLSYEEIALQLSLSVGAVQMLLFRARQALREELATASRRASILFPPWLANLIPSAERLAVPLRVGGAAAAAAVAVVAVAGAQRPDVAPPQPSTTPVASAPPAAPKAAPARRSTAAVRERGRRAAPARTAARPLAPTAEAAEAAPASAPAASTSAAEKPLLGLPTPKVSAPPLPAVPTVPSVPTLPAPTLPPPALPLPPLPIEVVPEVVPKELEGALDPQLDAVLAGR